MGYTQCQKCGTKEGWFYSSLNTESIIMCQACLIKDGSLFEEEEDICLVNNPDKDKI